MEYLIAALLGGFLTFNAVATPDRAERMVETVLQEQFPGAQVDVELEGKRGRRVLKGRFSRADVSLQNISTQETEAPSFSISAVPDAKDKGKLGEATIVLRDIVWGGVAIESIEFKASELVYDFEALKEENALRIVSSGPVTARLVMPEASVAKLVQDQLKSVQNPQLSFKNDGVLLRGGMPLPVIGGSVPFSLTGKLAARLENEIWLVEPKLALQNAPGMAVPAGPLMAGVNPLLVVDKEKKWPYRVRITNVQTREKKLDIAAELTFVPAPAVK